MPDDTNYQPDEDQTRHPEPAAADLIREKVARMYADEPDAASELAEADEAEHRSKHQRFIHDLSTSGKDLATIQTEWHNYYTQLTATEKHEVWQEFYSSQAALTGQPDLSARARDAHAMAEHKQEAAKPAKKLRDARSKKEVQTAIRDRVSGGGKLKAKHHLQSLLFGLGMGFLVLAVFLFGFFNEVFIAPFIQPGRANADTPLIVNSDTVAPTATPEVIIPKINVEIPVDYSQTSIDESVIENALENGVVHYPTTVMPGQNGNTAFFGHSSNNIFNKGKYKFAFVLLHKLVVGDTFYLTYNGKVYAYEVISRTVVDPSNIGVLGPVAGQTATATLITCDPPGTSLKRLIVVGKQISPDPAGNTQGSAAVTPTSGGSSPQNLPGNGPTLWGRFISTLVGKIIVVAVCAAATFYILRTMNRRVVRYVT
jgi:LPXTG-site transpeptidase (sortase) family protein